VLPAHGPKPVTATADRARRIEALQYQLALLDMNVEQVTFLDPEEPAEFGRHDNSSECVDAASRPDGIAPARSHSFLRGPIVALFARHRDHVPRSRRDRSRLATPSPRFDVLVTNCWSSTALDARMVASVRSRHA
jgi:hypothetical protein